MNEKNTTNVVSGASHHRSFRRVLTPTAAREGPPTPALIGPVDSRSPDYTSEVEAYLLRAYPEAEVPGEATLAARNGWQGTVLLKVRVLSTGRVDEVEVQKSSGFKLLDEEAKATVRTWQFTPSKRGSTAIDGWATVPIEFKLDT